MHWRDAEIDPACTAVGRRIFRSSRTRGQRVSENEIGVAELDKLLNKFSGRANGAPAEVGARGSLDPLFWQVLASISPGR